MLERKSVQELSGDDATQELSKLRPALLKRVLQRMGSYYGIALGTSLLGLWGFAALADEVLEREFDSFNNSVLLAIHAHMSSLRTTIAFFFTDLGSVAGVALLSLAVAIYYVRKKCWADLGVFAVLMIGGLLQIYFLKLYFHQVRPHVFNPLAVETTFSFPSGHSLGSFCFWGFIAWSVVERDPKSIMRWVSAFSILIIPTMVAWSRLYLGVHWPTDVVAGMLLAAFWVSACMIGRRLIARSARLARRRTAAA